MVAGAAAIIPAYNGVPEDPGVAVPLPAALLTGVGGGAAAAIGVTGVLLPLGTTPTRVSAELANAVSDMARGCV